MKNISRLCVLSAAGLLFTSPSNLLGQLVLEPAAAESKDATKAKTNTFIRIERDAVGKPESLQTAVASYKRRTGYNNLRVDLIGAVHVGDKEYYEQLNKLFESYDVVLYELVAPKGTVIPKGGRKGSGGNPISMLQGMTKSILNLSSQMELIDYTKKNFVHADMSPAEMQESMAKRGETPMTVALDALSEMMKTANLKQQKAIENNEPVQQLAADPFSLLFDSQRDVKLKNMMAEQFSEMGTDVMGNTINRVLVEDRNKAAMRVFSKELAKGHKKIAIFYGAAHLPDFEQRLEKDFDLKRAETSWLTAWDLTKPSKNKADDPVDSLFRNLLQPAQ